MNIIDKYNDKIKTTNLIYINAILLPVDNVTPVKEIEKIFKGLIQ